MVCGLQEWSEGLRVYLREQPPSNSMSKAAREKKPTLRGKQELTPSQRKEIDEAFSVS